MIVLQDAVVQDLLASSVTTATNNTAVVYLDQKALNGAREVLLDVTLEAATVTASASFNTINIVESDATDQTSFTTILQGTAGAPTASQFQFAAVHNVTTAPQHNLFSVPLSGRKRYIGVVVAPNNATATNRAVGVVATRLSRATTPAGSRSSGVHVVVI